MRIVICDDEREYIEQLEEILEDYASDKNGFRIHSCTTFEELKTYMDNNTADVYLLDIMMPCSSGIEIGQYIRDRHRDAYIIYISASEEYTFAAFGVHAFQYLKKPVDVRLLLETLEDIEELLRNKVQKMININTRDGLMAVPLHDIMYVENINRIPAYSLSDESCIYGLCNRSSFENNVGEICENEDFIHPHKSFFANMLYVRRMDAREFVMDDGKKIPISRNRFTQVKREYMRYLAAGGMR